MRGVLLPCFRGEEVKKLAQGHSADKVWHACTMLSSTSSPREFGLWRRGRSDSTFKTPWHRMKCSTYEMETPLAILFFDYSSTDACWLPGTWLRQGMWSVAQLITVQRGKRNSFFSQRAVLTHPSTKLKSALSRQWDDLNRASPDSLVGLAPPVIFLVIFTEAQPQPPHLLPLGSLLSGASEVCLLSWAWLINWDRGVRQHGTWHPGSPDTDFIRFLCAGPRCHPTESPQSLSNQDFVVSGLTRSFFTRGGKIPH